MLMSLLIALLAGVVAFCCGRRSPRVGADHTDWLAGALRALSRADEPRALASALAHHLESGLGAFQAEWWQRDDDGTYRSRVACLAGADASVLDLWIAEGRTWQRNVPSAMPVTPDAGNVLAATGGDLAVALALRGRPIGLLVVGPRRAGGPYGAADVAKIEALADHLLLVGEQARAAAQLDECRRMLQQATRLSTVGTLAAELAHEIRNPLVAVQTFLQILPERLDDPEVTIDLHAVALTELQRVARLLNELLGMARASVATFAATDLDVVVEQVVRLLQVSARKKDVALERSGDPLPTGAADASRLKQALVNLVLNAIQASPPGSAVQVTTRTLADATGRTVVELVIRDEGPGIPADVRERIFHPFFTTKEHGTGLGLPVTRQIVADHGGSIAVDVDAGRGAAFVVRLPLTMPVERRDVTPDVRAA